jgi:hypothetical protein
MAAKPCGIAAIPSAYPPPQRLRLLAAVDPRQLLRSGQDEHCDDDRQHGQCRQRAEAALLVHR